MKKSTIILRIVKIILVIIILSISCVNREIYGTWNVFSYPNRVFFGEYRYDNNGYIIVLKGSDKPQYEVSRPIDKFTGKRIYSKKVDFMGNGTEVYMQLGFNRYLVLGSGGGA